MKQYLTTPPAHMPISVWGDAGSKTGKYTIKAKYGIEKYFDVHVRLIEKARHNYVSISDRGNARFSSKAAEKCANFVREKIRANAYASMVPALSEEWAAYKSKVGYGHQVGIATEQMVENITFFRTNIKDHAFIETKHTGYVVGINQQADRKDSVISKLVSSKLSSAKTGKRRGSKSSYVPAANRYGSDFLNAKLWWLEHGHTLVTKTGIKHIPGRPIYTAAVEQFVREFGKKGESADFIGQLALDGKGNLTFKFKAHK